LASRKAADSERPARRGRKKQGILPDVLRPLQCAIRLYKNKDLPNRYDVELRSLDQLQSYDQVECHVVFYPYSRSICSDDIHFYPFEEYVNDVLSNQRSAYAEISSPLDQLFGLALGLLIALIFAHLSPASLLDIEAIVSVFGAYIVGKELWNDIERLLVNVSKNWRLRYQEGYYRYHLEKRTTLTYYSYLAKRQRYGKATLLPEKIDFIKQSNSQTLRMCFDTRDWDSLQKLQSPADEQRHDLDLLEPATAHVHSIHVAPELADDLQRDGFMFGVKLSLGRRILGLTRSLELFQSLQAGPQQRPAGSEAAPDGASLGCLDHTGQWHEGAVFYRNTWTWGRLKFYLNNGLLKDHALLDAQDKG
jgi:hypothetical protein